MSNKPKVLVVDDDENTCEVLVDLMTELGYEVLTAGDGNEALKKVEEEAPDIVLMDIRLPGLDGYDVCERIKEKKEAKTKVILYTAYLDAVNVARARDVGADDFQGKTSDLKNLRKAIERFVH